ncbi:MAG: response regulator transcription factor [Oscillospiraceae bacterium]|nr:response regulator transcription factor [Oscillospiraceae bacterium]
MSIKERVLIVEDDHGISIFLKTTLNANGYEVILAASGQEALSLAASHCPDVILLDLGLPDIDGNDVLSGIRKWSRVPIVVISARSSENDKAQALDMGADDYLTKPFGTVELLARIRTAIRHTRTCLENDDIAREGVFRTGDLVIDYKKLSVSVGGSDVHLTPNEYKIVALLGKHAGQILTYNYILRELWGPASSGDNKILRVHMASIRRKIEDSPVEPRYIFTEAGVGYRMAEENQQ